MLLRSWLPLGAVLLVQPPEALHEVALVDDQVSVVDPPLAMLAGVAVSVTTGRGTTVTVAVAVAEPPVPVQVRE
jgi:hypothetical protein